MLRRTAGQRRGPCPACARRCLTHHRRPGSAYLWRRPQGAPKLLQLGMQYPRVVRVRAEWAAPEGKGKQRAGGWALKTKAERILM